MMNFATRSAFKAGQVGHYATKDNPLMVFAEAEDGMVWVVMTRPGVRMGIAPENVRHIMITGDAPDRDKGLWAPVT